MCIGWVRIAVVLGAVCGVFGGGMAAEPPPTPAAWSMYALNPGHNAYYPSSFRAESWRYAVPGAVEVKANKALLNNTMARDLVGFPIGVAVVNDVVYATNDDGYLYALDAKTGKLEWRFHAFNQLMGTPVVTSVDGRELVFVGAGDSDFAYTHAVKFAEPGVRVIRGTGVSAVFALDARTGQQVWVYRTEGEDMPTPVLYRSHLLFGNGDGHVYSLDADTGKLAWKADIVSFVSMSSSALDPKRGVVVMGGTQPSRIYGVDAGSGKVLWSVAPPDVFSSSAGDGTWAIAGGRAIGQIETRRGDQAQTGTSSSEELAIDLADGRIVWSTNLGSGKVPPRNKDAVPVVVDGVVYTGSPVTHHEYALDATSGRILWQRPLPSSMKAAPTIIHGSVIQPAASGTIFTLDRRDGKVLHQFVAHEGGYGPQNGVAIGATFFIGTNAGTLQAIPLSQLGVRD